MYLYMCIHVQGKARNKMKRKKQKKMIDTIIVTITFYFLLISLLLVLVLEYGPGRGDTEQLLHNKHLYYRVGQTDKWICAHKNCNISLEINTRSILNIFIIY